MIYIFNKSGLDYPKEKKVSEDKPVDDRPWEVRYVEQELKFLRGLEQDDDVKYKIGLLEQGKIKEYQEFVHLEYIYEHDDDDRYTSPNNSEDY